MGRSYLRWLQAGNTSAYFDAVRAALSDIPQTRREIATTAGVSINFAATALDALRILGEAERCRQVGKHRAKLYLRAAQHKEDEAVGT